MKINFFKKNILIVGCNGMLGSTVFNFLKNKNIFKNIVGVGRDLFPIDQFKTCDDFIENLKFKPDIVINCAAFTDTKKNELPSFYEISYRSNVLGVKNLAKLCVKNNMELIHISTDYVYSQLDDLDPEFPGNIYGLQKLLAEKIIKEIFGRKNNYLILRASWLFGENSEKTFIYKILSAAKNILDKNSKIDKLNVVCNCFGYPTSVNYLSRVIFNCIVYNVVGQCDIAQRISKFNKNPISRYQWAFQILNTAKKVCNQFNFLSLKKVKQPERKIDNSFDVFHPTYFNKNPTRSLKFKNIFKRMLQKFKILNINKIFDVNLYSFKETKLIVREILQNQSKLK